MFLDPDFDDLGVVFHLSDHLGLIGEYPAGYWTFLPGPDRLDPEIDDIPEEFTIAGYDAVISIAGYMHTYFPRSDELTYRFSCSPSHNRERILEVTYCSLLVRYESDHRIKLKARIYHPQPFDESVPRFRVLAQKMDAITRCLDVTDGGSPPPPPPAEPYHEGSLTEWLDACSQELRS